MGTITLLIILYIIYLLYKSRKELTRLFSKYSAPNSQADTTTKRTNKSSGSTKEDILGGKGEYVDFEEINDDKNTK